MPGERLPRHATRNYRIPAGWPQNQERAVSLALKSGYSGLRTHSYPGRAVTTSFCVDLSGRSIQLNRCQPENRVLLHCHPGCPILRQFPRKRESKRDFDSTTAPRTKDQPTALLQKNPTMEPRLPRRNETFFWRYGVSGKPIATKTQNLPINSPAPAHHSAFCPSIPPHYHRSPQRLISRSSIRPRHPPARRTGGGGPLSGNKFIAAALLEPRCHSSAGAVFIGCLIPSVSFSLCKATSRINCRHRYLSHVTPFRWHHTRPVPGGCGSEPFWSSTKPCRPKLLGWCGSVPPRRSLYVSGQIDTP